MARAQSGDVKSALALLAESRALVERAELLRRRPRRRAVPPGRSAATGSRASRPRSASSTRPSSLAERSGLPCDDAPPEHLRLALALLPAPARLRGRARGRRARARARRGASTTRGRSGQAYFQASILAERDGHWVLARTYAEKAKVQYEELTDRANVGRLLNNLGGLEFLLGKPEQAIEQLKHSFAVALEIGRDEDAAEAVSSLAQVHLRTGDRSACRGAGAARARDHRRPRRHARPRSATRGSCSAARCSSRTASTRPTTAFAAAEDAFAPTRRRPRIALRRGSPKATWRPNVATNGRASVLFRRAAETLQDFRF